MNLQQLKGKIRPLPLFLIVVLLIGAIITIIWLSSEKLRPEEEVALRFVEAAYVHHDLEKLRPLVSEDSNINISVYKNDTFSALPGKVWVGYRETFDFKYVIVFIPETLTSSVNLVEFTIGKHDNKILHEESDGSKSFNDFEEFQTTEFWQRRGYKFEWKEAELH